MSDVLDLSAGISKKIFIDPKRLRKGEHAWTISTEQGEVVAASLRLGIWEGVYSKTPLFSGGPNCWIETRDEYVPEPDATMIAWPVPIRGQGVTKIDLSAGILKRVHVDRHKLRETLPAWAMRTDEGLLLSDGLPLGEGIEGVQSRQSLFPGGPKAWIAATAEIIVEPEERIHQKIFPIRLSPTEVPHHGSRG